MNCTAPSRLQSLQNEAFGGRQESCVLNRHVRSLQKGPDAQHAPRAAGSGPNREQSSHRLVAELIPAVRAVAENEKLPPALAEKSGSSQEIDLGGAATMSLGPPVCCESP